MINIEFKRFPAGSVPPKKPNVLVKVTEMGNITEIQYMEKRNHKQTIQMLKGGEKFVICSTGEVMDCRKGETRADNKKGLYKTFANARAMINANVTDVSKVRWCTLTYAENMTDPKRLKTDFEKFIKRLYRHCESQGLGKPEYIVMMEPQGRGAWHAHLLLIWQDRKAPFISNATLRALWGQGFVKIKKLDNCDNVGAYLTAYLGDMELSEINEKVVDLVNQKGVKEVEIEENGKKFKKSIIKGARLDLYPANFNMLRYSKGCVKPTECMMTQDEAQKKVLGATKTFQSAVQLLDPANNYDSVLIKEQYNRLRKSPQG